MRQLRRANQPGGAVYRPGQLIRPRLLGEPPPPPPNPIYPYYGTAVLVHLEVDHAMTTETGQLTAITNPAKAGAAGDLIGSNQATRDGLWIDASLIGPQLGQEFDLANKRLMFPFTWFPTTGTRPIRMFGFLDGSVTWSGQLNYSGNGLLAGTNYSDGTTTVLTTPRVTAPASGGKFLGEWQMEPGSGGLMGHYWQTGLHSYIQTVFTRFPFRKVGGTPTQGMPGAIGDIVLLDRTSPDFDAALVAAQQMLSEKYGITYPVSALVQPRFGPHEDVEVLP